MNILLAALAAATLPGATPQGPSAQLCIKDADERIIEVLAPGEVGRSCDLKYTRDGGKNVSVPYHADNSVLFCEERATALVQSLKATGFGCATAPMVVSDAPATDQVHAETALATSQTPTVLAQIPAAPESTPLRDQAVAELLEPLPTPPAAPPSLAPATASAGPTPLAPTNVSSIPMQRLGRTPVGRVVGAPPEATPANMVDSAAPAQSSLNAGPKFRPSEDVIRGVLAAQTAAWNDGDIDGFMGGYWNNPNLKLISGTNLTRGWAPALRRYREQFGSSSGPGRLEFQDIEVSLLTDDVALAAGRYRLTRDTDVESGMFTLVLKRIDGLWRIVHDHSVGDRARQ